VKLLLIDNEPQTARKRLAELSTLGFEVDWIRALDEAAADLLENAGYEAALIAFRGAWTEQHWQWLEWLLARVRAPVLIAGPREALPWIERALDAGAEDFLIEPIDLQDLAVRIRVCARRGGRLETNSAMAVKPRSPGRIELRLNPVQRIAMRGGEAIPLTNCEYIILAILMTEPGQIVPRVQLEQQLYAGGEGEVSSNTVEVYIHNLRRKLGDRLIRTARGRGYWVDLGSGVD
jgi:DNA-binding response OmpR family regulator